MTHRIEKIYYLSTCDTCKRLMKPLPITDETVLQDVKKQPISLSELEALRQYTDSYESLVNKRAQLYKEQNLKDKSLSEEQYKALILEHYTFLKRPIAVTDSGIFVSNDIKNLM